LESRFEVYAEQYCLAIEVEARLAVRIARTQIYPAVMASLGELAGSLQEQEAIGLTPSKAVAQQIGARSQQLLDRAALLESALDATPHGAEAHMRHCADQLLVRMEELREAADGLEALVDDAAWPLPTYQEMLFVR
jgi:glutamine synthetase